jgi:SAM-dependent methyltransferase
VTESISFDRAAGYYDQTRGFPPGVENDVADAVAELIGPGARILEVGIGTGRIARPLLGRGYSVTGVDLSRNMMDRLLEALPPDGPRPSLLEADATQLPLAPGRFDAVISVHVFHLIAGWREALAEARRSLRPDGALLLGRDWRPDDATGSMLGNKWREIVRSRGLAEYQPGAHDLTDVTHALIETGAHMEMRWAGEWTTTRTLARHLETIEHRTWSATWHVPEGFFPGCLDELRAWALDQWGSLDREFTTPHRFLWQRFTWDR